MIAVINQNLFIYDALIDRNDIDVNSQDIYGNSIAHYAICSSNDELRDKIFNNPKIDINIQNNKLMTPLHYAINCENKEIAISLIKNERINIKIKNKNGHTPLKLAKIEYKYKITDLLRFHPQNKIADKYILHIACKNRDLNSFIDLIKKENDYNQKDIFIPSIL